MDVQNSRNLADRGITYPDDSSGQQEIIRPNRPVRSELAIGIFHKTHVTPRFLAWVVNFTRTFPSSSAAFAGILPPKQPTMTPTPSEQKKDAAAPVFDHDEIQMVLPCCPIARNDSPA